MICINNPIDDSDISHESVSEKTALEPSSLTYSNDDITEPQIESPNIKYTSQFDFQNSHSKFNYVNIDLVSTTSDESNINNIGKVWVPPQKREFSITRKESTIRQVKSMLNKLTIEKFETIAEKIAALVEDITCEKDLELIANLVLDKAVIEPDWNEMYADLCMILKWRSPVLDPQIKSSFSSYLLKKTQSEYENMPRDASYYTSDDGLSYKLKRRLLGIVKIIGGLFLRKMFGFKVINSLVIDLVISNDEPFEHLIECFIQLIYTTGYYIEKSTYSPALDMWFGRLTELLNRKVYSKRIRCMIQDALDLRQSNWKKNVHKETAKALSELRYQVEAEDVVGGHHLAVQYGNIVTVGKRSSLSYYNYILNQEKMALEKEKGRIATQSSFHSSRQSMNPSSFPHIDYKYSFIEVAPLNEDLDSARSVSVENNVKIEKSEKGGSKPIIGHSARSNPRGRYRSRYKVDNRTKPTAATQNSSIGPSNDSSAVVQGRKPSNIKHNLKIFNELTQQNRKPSPSVPKNIQRDINTKNKPKSTTRHSAKYRSRPLGNVKNNDLTESTT